jgi:hypothetical protein
MWMRTSAVRRPRIEAAQLSIEEAAKAAGLIVKAATATVNGVTLYYRDIGRRTEPVVLLHGFPETGDAFASAVATLGKRYRPIVPDMRGAGGSQRPTSGYDKRTLASDVKELMDQLGVKRAHVVGHDIGARTADPQPSGRCLQSSWKPHRSASRCSVRS